MWVVGESRGWISCLGWCRLSVGVGLPLELVVRFLELVGKWVKWLETGSSANVVGALKFCCCRKMSVVIYRNRYRVLWR